MENQATSLGGVNVDKTNLWSKLTSIPNAAAAGLAVRINNRPNLESFSLRQAISQLTTTFLHASPPCSASSTSVDDWSSRVNNDELSEYQLSDIQGYSSLSNSYQHLLVRHTVDDYVIGESHQLADGAYLQPVESTNSTALESFLTPIDHPAELNTTPASVQVEVSEELTGSTDNVINASSTLYQHTDMSVDTHVNSITALFYDSSQNSADTSHAANVLYDSHNNTDSNSYAANVLYDQTTNANEEDVARYATIPEAGDGEYAEIEPEPEGAYNEIDDSDREDASTHINIGDIRSDSDTYTYLDFNNADNNTDSVFLAISRCKLTTTLFVIGPVLITALVVGVILVGLAKDDGSADNKSSSVVKRANCDYYRPNMSSYTKEAKLVGCCDQNSFAHIITASGELDDILENVFIDINLTDRYIHGYNEFSSSRQCHLNVADDGKFVIVTDCSKTIFISVDCGRMFRKLEANNFFYKVEAAAKVSNYSSDNGTALLWVLGQNSSQTQLMTLRLERTSISYDVVEQKNIDLGVHSVSLNGYAASYTDIVDDGKGHMVFFRRSNDTAVPNNVYYCWVDVSTGQGYFGGVLIRAVDIGRLSTAGITSIAVDTNRSLLYLGHDKIISVYTLVYNAL